MTKNQGCELIIFGESHTDAGSTKTILDLLPILKNKGYTNYLFEESSDVTYNLLVNNLKQTLETFLSQVTKNIEIILSSVGITNLVVDAAFIKILNDYYGDVSALRPHIDQYMQFELSYKSTLNLLAEIKSDLDLSMHFVDLPALRKHRLEMTKGVLSDEYISKRDIYMAKQAEKICQNGGNKQVLLVGYDHHKIAKILESKGFIVNKIAVFYDKPQEEKDIPDGLSQEEMADQLSEFYDREAAELDPASQPYHVIDLYKHPELNVTEIVMDYLNLHPGNSDVDSCHYLQ